MTPSGINYSNLADALGIKGKLTGRELRAGCPIHGGHDANFSLNVENGLWSCFSTCGSGDFTTLVQKALGITTREAERWVASNGRAIDPMVLAKQLRDSLEPVQAEPEEPAWARRYQFIGSQAMPIAFLERGFTWAMIERWGIRYDPLPQQVVIPYYDHHQELIGTVSRNMVALPKYINSPALPKSLSLFGYYRLQEFPDTITIVEGPLDAIWLQELGYPAVAALGVSLSKAQLFLLQRLGARRVYVGTDMDKAGAEAAALLQRDLLTCWAASTVQRLRFPNGKKDAQECGPEELRQAYQEV